MEHEGIYRLIEEFSKESHGRTDYHKEEIFVASEGEKTFVPLKFLSKRLEKELTLLDLQKMGFVAESYGLLLMSTFDSWYEQQFSRKLEPKYSRNILLVHIPNNKLILETLAVVNKSYEILRKEKVLINAKKLPVQLGEWYAKCIFGLNQIKSPSQRGFDFKLGDKTVEVKAQWGDYSSPKGVKIRKSLVELSDYCIIIYIAKNLNIREVCFLDSEFVIRKFSAKGHTLFLKDQDLLPYFFSKSNKHFDKIASSTPLMRFATPSFAANLSEHFPS